MLFAVLGGGKCKIRKFRHWKTLKMLKFICWKLRLTWIVRCICIYIDDAMKSQEHNWKKIDHQICIKPKTGKLFGRFFFLLIPVSVTYVGVWKILSFLHLKCYENLAKVKHDRNNMISKNRLGHRSILSHFLCECVCVRTCICVSPL